MFKHEPKQKDFKTIHTNKNFETYENTIKLIALLFFLTLIFILLKILPNVFKVSPLFGYIFGGIFGVFYICIAFEALYKAFIKPINNDFTNKEIKDITFNSLIFGFFIDFWGISCFFQLADNVRVLWIKEFLIILIILLGYFLNIFFVSINILLLLRRFYIFCSKINIFYKIKNLVSFNKLRDFLFINTKDQYLFFKLPNNKRIKFTLLIIPAILMDIIKSILKMIIMFFSIFIIAILSSIIILYKLFRKLFIKPILYNKDTTFLQMTSGFAFILSFLITLGIISYENIINDASLTIFEFIGSVIIIPLVITQILNMNNKKNNLNA
jgi:hypothetical protein